MVRYRLFGYRLASPFVLPDFDVCRDEADALPADLVVEFAEVLAWDPEFAVEREDHAWGVRGDAFLMRSPATGVVELRPDGRILASADVRRVPRLFRTLLTNTLVPAAALQRGESALHCAAVAVGGRAVALTGSAGQGKSTLALACWRRGHAVVTEDIGVLERREQGVAMRPGIPYFRLWPDALPTLGLDAGDWPPVYGQIGKRQVAFPQAYFPNPLPLGAVVQLETAPSGSDEIRIERLAGFEAIKALLMAIPFAAVQHTPHMYRQFFDGCAALADAVPIYCLRRPRGMEHLDRTVAGIEALMAAGEAGGEA